MQYAERLAIGLESVIRNVPATSVKDFYDKWYTPENMAVVVVGDFKDAESIAELIKEKLENCQPRGQADRPEIPRYAHDASQA